MNKFINFKKAIEEPAIPNRILIIISNPRSGSTWLFDAIRYHPAVDMLISGIIYTKLSLIGRRYPRDLSSQTIKNSLKVEIRPDIKKNARIPEFNLPENFSTIPQVLGDQCYAIEKIHPHFYSYNSGQLLKSINDLGRDHIELKLLYLVRDPRASLESFFNYQKRNPSWNAQRTPRDVMTHLATTYQNISEMAGLKQGLVLDYGELIGDFNDTLFRVFEYLWPGTSPNDTSRAGLIQQIKRETAWENRKSEKPFLGEKKGFVSGHHQIYDPLFKEFQEDINKCYQSYQDLIKTNASNL